MKENKIEDICVFHWLNSLYQDFLYKRIAGDTMPCTTCPKLKDCESCPPINFNISGGKFGLKVNYARAQE